MKLISGIALAIAIVGCLNWGLIALFEFDLVVFLFGNMTFLTRTVYGLVGLSGLCLFMFFGRLD